MPTIAQDCQVILDGTGYFIEPQSYVMDRPRVRKADYTRQPAAAGAGVGERYVDFGPGKREWTFTVVAYQAIRKYDGTFVALSGQQYRDALHASYQKVNTTLQFTDPLGTVWTVHFDNLAETIIDVRQQADNESLQYLCTVALVEA